MYPQDRYKIKDLCENIIKKLITKEEKEENSDSEYKYYFKNQDDGNLFEILNNTRQLGIKTKLEESDAQVALEILQIMICENYWIFEEFTDLFHELDDDTIDKMKMFIHPNLWKKHLAKYLDGFIEVEKYDKPPTVDHSYGVEKLSNFPQTILKLKDINNTLRMTENGVVNIL